MALRAGRTLGIALGLVVIAGCSRDRAPALPYPSSSASAALAPPSASALAEVPLPPPPIRASWKQALREHRWHDARAALQDHPDKTWVHRVALAFACEGLSDWSCTSEQLRVGADAPPEIAPWIARHLREALLRQGDTEAVQKEDKRDSWDAVLAAAKVLASRDETKLAAAAFSRALKLAPSSRKASVLLERGREALRLGKRDAARSDWLKALGDSSNGDIARALISDLRAASLLPPEGARRKLAAGLVDRGLGAAALELGIDEAREVALYGEALYAARRYADAEKALRKAEKDAGKGRGAIRLLIARARARSGDDAGAVSMLEGWAKAGFGDAAGEARALRIKLLMILGRYDEARAVQGAAPASGPEAYKRVALDLLTKHAAEAKRNAAALAKKTKSGDERSQARLFGALASEALGDASGAKALWQAVVKDDPQSIWGTLARIRLEPPGEPSGDSVAQKGEMRSGSSRPAWLLALLSEGLDEVADDVLATTSLAGGQDERCALAEGLESQRKTYRLALGALAPEEQKYWPLHCAYPRPYGDTVEQAEARSNLPVGIIHAVMRQESAFDSAAISSANARGLMQLLETTANRIEPPPENATFDRLLVPATNIDLGARYLRTLLDQSQHLAVAIASYNAGPRAVRSWLPKKAPIALELWLALIPYGETRTYVPRVLSNWVRYRGLYRSQVRREELPLEVPPPAREVDPASLY